MKHIRRFGTRDNVLNAATMDYWMYKVASTGTFVKDSSMTS